MAWNQIELAAAFKRRIGGENVRVAHTQDLEELTLAEVRAGVDSGEMILLVEEVMAKAKQGGARTKLDIDEDRFLRLLIDENLSINEIAGQLDITPVQARNWKANHINEVKEYEENRRIEKGIS